MRTEFDVGRTERSKGGGIVLPAQSWFRRPERVECRKHKIVPRFRLCQNIPKALSDTRKNARSRFNCKAVPASHWASPKTIKDSETGALGRPREGNPTRQRLGHN